ncbi:tlde1 domain-containing protein [Paraburkholderia diazotrophica]|uniref:tlde1 domain-containing protein n=1 Tax=Paraburkholderia diazotrophica TaxID=667676 RepID=UPI00317B0CED
MPWTYSQSTGRLTRNGVTAGTGYSGHGAGRNNANMQRTGGIGPIPQGTYTIGAPFHHNHAGGYTMRLTPQHGTNTFGRSGFMMHGDSTRQPGQASEGCIVQNHSVRHQVWASGDRTLQVVP